MTCDGCLRKFQSEDKMYEVLTGPKSGAVICVRCTAESSSGHPIKFIGTVA